MTLKDISNNYGCKFAFTNDDPLIPYMILNGRGLGLGFVSFVDLNNGNIASFSEGDSALDVKIRLKYE
jgi:hypothetical protein